MKPTNAQAHGTDEVLVTFDDNGQPRNHLLRKVPELHGRYTEHAERSADRRAAIEAEIAKARAAIDEDAFAAAYRAIEAEKAKLATPTPAAP